ncbi:hypothetical protein EC9_08090 [Rosistilla ulvae]|uniref:Cytochrome c domain-containing protein n=1 Tax=Rosistilla ulvae TaxID=1930277 RepID=A0A517LVI6_9BACT|nr:DUF1553 domain-containing protein [Rosistilla ulvae]QDS86636.1 hypothetical protein EC9_08090 [Rosistilla ulvae]
MRRICSRFRGFTLLYLLILGIPAWGGDEAALHERVDEIIGDSLGDEPAAAIADDAEFFRRVWLDLAGTIPPAEATRKFLADPSTDKRSRAIDQLLAAPTYVTRMQQAFHVMLMERRGDHESWQKFLELAFKENKSWDSMVRAMLEPQPSHESHQGASFFLTKRLEKYGQNPIDHPGLTSDIGRLFLGVDLQCAQCHDHLLVDEYKQLDFQGLLAVTQTLKPAKGGPIPLVAEKPLTEKLEFVSVFESSSVATGPRIPFGKEFEIPSELPEDRDYSPLGLVANELPTATNPPFSRNIANRIWHLMLGRGLVEPLDSHHADNLPSHPELLELLAAELAAHQFDLKWLFREIALSDTYQRSSRIVDANTDIQEIQPDQYQVAIPKRLSAEQAVTSFAEAIGAGRDEDERSEFISRLKPLFVAALANPAREHEDHRHPSVRSALFFANDKEVLAAIERQPGNLIDRLMAIEEETALADELYLSVVSRFPSDEERTELAAFLTVPADQREAHLRHWIWALLASTEFNVNH